MRSNIAMYDGSTAQRAIPPMGDADEIYKFVYDHTNDCRYRISAILARSPMLRTDPDEDKALPPFELWVVLHKAGQGEEFPLHLDPVQETMRQLEAEGIL